MIDNPDHITSPAVKAASAVFVAGGAISIGTLTAINLWVQIVAGVLAGTYSLILLSEWAWKRHVRPFLQKRGLVKMLVTTDTNA